jgi:hypothetical protein
MRNSNLNSMNILIIHVGALGDCVLTIHLAMAMRCAGYRVTLAARSPIAAWAARRSMIDESISLDHLSPMLWADAPHSDGRNSDACSIFETFDCIISFLGGPNEAVARRLNGLCGPDRVIHIDSRPTEKTQRDGIHITHQWAADLRTQAPSLKFEISDPQCPESPGTLPRYDVTKSPRHHIATSPLVLVHPGSGGLSKCCSLDAMEALVRELLTRGWNALWMIGPDEVERDGPEFRRRLERTASVIFEESVDVAADLVASADAFIGNDAGMTHVAALAGVNTVALYGSTDPRVWRPLGSNCAVFRFPSVDKSVRNWVASLMRIVTHEQ